MRRSLLYYLPLALALLSVTVCAQESSQRAALREMSGVSVEVATLNSAAITLGLDQRQLQVDIELRLRQAGIRVLNSPKHPPVLFVQVNGIKVTESVYGYNIEVEVVDEVEIRRKSSRFILATIWSDGAGGSVGVRAGEGVRDRLKDLVDRFINDYLAVNPR